MIDLEADEPDSMLVLLAKALVAELGYKWNSYMPGSSSSNSVYCEVLISEVNEMVQLRLRGTQLRARASKWVSGAVTSELILELSDPDSLDKLVQFYRTEIAKPYQHRMREFGDIRDQTI